MPSTIQRQPAGLLSLLTATSDGEAPYELLDSVTGMVELAPYYGVARRDSRTYAITGASIVAGGVGFYPPAAGANVLVPNGQLFVVHYLGAYVTPPNPTTGTNFRFCVGFQNVRDPDTFVPHGIDGSAPPSGGAQVAGGPMPRPFLMTPLDVPCLFVEAGSASAGNMRISLIFDRIRY